MSTIYVNTVSFNELKIDLKGYCRSKVTFIGKNKLILNMNMFLNLIYSKLSQNDNILKP